MCSYYIHEILRSGAVLGIVLHAKHFHELHCGSTGPSQNLCYLLASHSDYLEENYQRFLVKGLFLFFLLKKQSFILNLHINSFSQIIITCIWPIDFVEEVKAVIFRTR